MDYRDKYKKMDECWNRYNQAYIDEKITRESLKTALKTLQLKFRFGIESFMNLLTVRKVPMTVISAGITDVIEILMDQNNLMFDCVQVLSNKMIFSEQPPNYCLDFSSPPIHILNKDKVLISSEHQSTLINRHNILLLGDSLGDLKMIHGFKYNQVLLVGFLNQDIDEKIDSYQQAYDIVITGDSDFVPINEIAQAILS